MHLISCRSWSDLLFMSEISIIMEDSGPKSPDYSPRPLSSLLANEKQMNGSGGNVGGKKRKAPTIVVNLHSFVRAMHLAYNDTKYNDDKLIIPDIYTKYYVEVGLMEPETASAAKQSKTVPSNTELAKTVSSPDTANRVREQYKESLYLQLFMQIVQDLETRNATFQFSREALKYFLATRSRFVTRANFAETNQLQKTEKNRGGKAQQPLPFGAILLEYIKCTDSFVHVLHRSCKEDIAALKAIIDLDIRIPISIYDIAKRVKFETLQYRTYQEDQQQISLVDYAKIPIPSSTFKRAQILVTRYLVLLRDGNQFIINPTIEKDFSALLSKKCIPQDGYIVFDTSIGVKSKIIDIIDMRLENCTLPNAYLERLSLINSKFPKLKTLKPTNEPGNSNFLFKPLNGSGVSYIKLKPLLTAAVIGIGDRYAYATLLVEPDERELTVVTKFSVSGQAACMIATAEFQDPQQQQQQQPPTIRIKNETYTIVGGDLENVSLFAEAVLVEIRDAHKFGGISDRPVSTRDEYKQMYQVNRDIKTNESLQEMLNDPSRAEEIVEVIANSASFERVRSLFECNSSRNFEPFD